MGKRQLPSWLWVLAPPVNKQGRKREKRELAPHFVGKRYRSTAIIIIFSTTPISVYGIMANWKGREKTWFDLQMPPTALYSAFYFITFSDANRNKKYRLIISVLAAFWKCCNKPFLFFRGRRRWVRTHISEKKRDWERERAITIDPSPTLDPLEEEEVVTEVATFYCLGGALTAPKKKKKRPTISRKWERLQKIAGRQRVHS